MPVPSDSGKKRLDEVFSTKRNAGCSLVPTTTLESAVAGDSGALPEDFRAKVVAAAIGVKLKRV